MKKIPRIGRALCITAPILVLTATLLRVVNPTYAAPGGAVRGVSGDRWADIVLGKRSFGEISIRGVLPNKMSSPGGVVIDNSGAHPIAYIWDSNNSRIIGINLDDCYGQGDRCTAAIVLGQPSATDYGSCNQDASFQYYPEKAPASASTLCGTPEWTHTTLEDKSSTHMFVDTSGNLFVPDIMNNRILEYYTPMTTDTVADQVWGQADFTGTQCNLTQEYRGALPSPSNSSLCLYSHNYNLGSAGVTLDATGNMWVADSNNNRVVRFPKDGGSGVISKTADIVLGQPNLTSSDSGTNLDQMSLPTSLGFDASGNLLVADTENQRVLKFTAPFSSGMSGTELLSEATLVDGVSSIHLEPSKNYFWTDQAIGWGATLKKWDTNGNYQNTFIDDWSRGDGSLGFETDGSILFSSFGSSQDVVRYVYDVGNAEYQFDRGFFSPPYQANMTTANRLNQGGSAGVAVESNGQMVVTDGRLLYWNDPLNATNGQAPDGYVGGTSSTDTTLSYTDVRRDNNDKIYTLRASQSIYLNTEVVVYQGPLTNSSTPITVLNSPIPVLGGGQITFTTLSGITPSHDGAYIWVSDSVNSRVFRIRNWQTSPEVDVILGQTSTAGVSCNKGVIPDPAASSTDADLTMLCNPGVLQIDTHGNLFVNDAYLEISGNLRILMFSADTFADNLSTALYAPEATKSFPRYSDSNATPHATLGIAFSSQNAMVVGNNPYQGTRFATYYTDPTNVNPSNKSDPAYAIPDGMFNDFSSWIFGLTFDSDDNLYSYDSNRGQVLIYKQPLGAPVGPASSPNPTPTPSPTPTPTPGASPTPTPSSSSSSSSSSTGTSGQGSTTSKTSSASQRDTLIENDDTHDQVKVAPALALAGKKTGSAPTPTVDLEKSVADKIRTRIAALPLLLLTGILAVVAGSFVSSLPSFLEMSHILFGFFIPRRSRAWGKVYDAETGKPIPFARILLTQKNSGETMATSSDFLGVYRFHASNKIPATLTVIAGGYKLHSILVSASEKYANVYNLPLKRQIQSKSPLWQYILTERVSVSHFVRTVAVVLMVLGFAVSIFMQSSSASSINLVLIAVYGVLFFAIVFSRNNVYFKQLDRQSLA